MDGRTEVIELAEITPLNNSFDSKYNIKDYAKFGFASSLGGIIWGTAALSGSIGGKYALPYTAIVSSFFSTLTGTLGFYTRNKTSDFVTPMIATGFAIGLSTAVMVGGAAVPVIANTTFTPLSEALICTGTAIANAMITPAATMLLGFGLFKAKKYLPTDNAENDSVEERQFSFTQDI